MIKTEIINRIFSAVQANDKEQVMQLIAAGKKENKPIENLHFLEALFWIKNADLNKTRTALFKELRHFPQNSDAARLFILLQPAAQNSGNGQNLRTMLRSIEYIQDI